MPKKKSTSDTIKALLTAHPLGGGLVSEWKRVSKAAGPNGTVVREFENAKRGRRLAVTEYPEGRFEVSAPGERLEDSRYLPALETDAAANEAADRLMAAHLGDGLADEDELTADEESLVAAAGPKAIANRFLFALSETYEEGQWQWFISPRASWEKDGACDDRSMPFLTLPRGMGGVMEACWEWDDGRTPLEQARELISRGFIWDEGFQDMIASSASATSDLTTGFIAALKKEQDAARRRQAPKPGPQPGQG